MADMAQTASPASVPGWRLTLGIALLALSLLGPLIAIPLLSMFGLSAALIASLSGAILIGAEVLLVAAVAVMGKSGYEYIKDWALGLLRRYGPPAEVSRIMSKVIGISAAETSPDTTVYDPTCGSGSLLQTRPCPAS